MFPETESVSNSGRGEATDCTEEFSEDETPVKILESEHLIQFDDVDTGKDENLCGNDNDDTQSIGSVSEFHDSLPVVISTPHSKGNMIGRTADPDDFSEKTNSQEDGKTEMKIIAKDAKVIRQLFLPSSEDSSQATSIKSRPSTADSKKTTGTMITTSKGTKTIKPIGNRQARLHTAKAVKLEDGVLATHLQSKVAELKSEMVKFKMENVKLIKSRLEYDSVSLRLFHC